MKRYQKEVTESKTVPFWRRLLQIVGLPLWVLAGFLLSAILVGLADEILRLSGLVADGMINSSLRNTIIAAFVYAIAIVIVIGIPAGLKRASTTREELGLTRWPNWFDIVLAPTSFVVYMLLAGMLLAAVAGLFPGFDAEQVQDVGFDNVSQTYEYVLAFITLVIVAPIAEEVLVRGYLYGKLRKVTSLTVAMLLSSLLFSVMHFQWNVALSVLPLGIVLVMLREMTGSIWAGILLHMLKNGVAFYFLFVNPTLMNTIGV